MSGISSGVLWAVVVALCLSGVAAAPLLVRDRTVAFAERVVSTEHVDGPSSPRPSTDSIWQTAPFRIDRSPPPLRFGAVEPVAGAEERAQSPEWLLTGVLVGQPPVAVFEDRERSGATYVVSTGDSVGDYHIRAIWPDSVAVTVDTLTWTFVLETPWS